MRSNVIVVVLGSCLTIGCATGAGSGPEMPAGSGGPTGSGGGTASGGATATGGATGSGGTTATGGTGSGGAAPSGSGGSAGPAGHAGAAGSGAPPGGGGRTGSAGRNGSGGSGGAAGASSTTGGGGAGDVDCSAAFPSGGTTHTGTNVNGMADGLNYGIWTNGSGGSITVFPDTHAFSASWNNSQDFLAHVGLDFNTSKAYTSYGTIAAQFSEQKSGTAGSFSSIGMYGWMHSPCIEWYINEDSFGGLGARGSATATIDGATYYLTMTTTTGTGGANACEAGHSGSWIQIHSTRQAARSCGTVTVSDHFAAWEKQGWTLGTLASVHINVEVGGGNGSIQFPVANVTTTSK
jgi:hypothetical protein